MQRYEVYSNKLGFQFMSAKVCSPTERHFQLDITGNDFIIESLMVMKHNLCLVYRTLALKFGGNFFDKVTRGRTSIRRLGGMAGLPNSRLTRRILVPDR
jgi:hypothetical protein